VSDESLLAFSRAFADSTRCGLSPVLTLRNLSLDKAAEAVGRGETLHAALGCLSRFPSVLIALVRAGEESGKLDAFLDRYSASLESRIDFRRRLQRVLVYPAFASALVATIFLLFSTKGTPILLELLIAAGVAVPPVALHAMKAGEFFLANWPFFLGGFVTTVLAVSALLGSRPGRMARALAGHWLPGARYVCEEARWYELEATLELVLGAGLRPRETMEILGQCFRDDPLTARRLSHAAEMMAQGKGFTESLAPGLPAHDRTVLAVAECSGLLDETFGKLAKSHRELHLHRLKQAATAFQLATVAALAPLCFGLILWILWPTLAVLQRAESELTGATAPAAVTPELAAPGPSPHTAMSVKASRFNETQGRQITGYMQEHAASESSEAPADGDKPAKKKTPVPKLKPMEGMKRTQFRRIEPTSVKSGLE
jgi:type II secretory pathway component PulF